MATYPKQYLWITSRFGKVMKAHQRLGEELLAVGPLKKKQALISTIGFPAVSAAISWAREIIEKKA